MKTSLITLNQPLANRFLSSLYTSNSALYFCSNFLAFSFSFFSLFITSFNFLAFTFIANDLSSDFLSCDSILLFFFVVQLILTHNIELDPYLNILRLYLIYTLSALLTIHNKVFRHYIFIIRFLFKCMNKQSFPLKRGILKIVQRINNQ